MPEAATDNDRVGRTQRLCAELADVALKKQRRDKTCVKSEKAKGVNGKDGQNGQNGQNGKNGKIGKNGKNGQNGRHKTKTKLKVNSMIRGIM
jgi:hypothetical protein